jgi:hypothetical protein
MHLYILELNLKLFGISNCESAVIKLGVGLFILLSLKVLMGETRWFEIYIVYTVSLMAFLRDTRVPFFHPPPLTQPILHSLLSFSFYYLCHMIETFENCFPSLSLSLNNQQIIKQKIKKKISLLPSDFT